MLHKKIMLQTVIIKLINAETEIEYFNGLQIPQHIRKALSDIDEAINILMELQREELKNERGSSLQR